MSRNIYRRSNRTGTTSTDLLRDPIGTIAELRAYPVTDTLDKTLIYVKGESGVFAYHYDSTASDDGSEVIQPASGSGRWIKVIGSDSYTDEEAQDAIFDFLVAGTNITLTHDDAANSLTIDAADTNTNQLTEWTVSDGSNTSTVAHNDTVEFSGTGGITVSESSKTVTIDGSGISGDTYTLTATQDGSNVDLTLDASSGTDSTVQLTAGSNITLTRNSATEVTIAASGGATDNLGNHTATQDLNMGTHDITGNKLRFVDTSAFSTHPDYFFYGKYDAGESPNSKPAKIILYADDGDTGAGRGEYISIQPPDAGQLSSSYGLKLPTTTGSADQVLTLPSGWSGTGTAQLEWQDRCCDNGITDITIGAEGAPSGDGELSWDGSTDTLTYTPPDLSGYATSASLATVATSGAYSDVTGTPNLIGGTGVDITVAGNDHTFTADLNEFNAYSGSPSYFIVLASGTGRKISPSNIDISSFNNDAGYVTTDTNTFRTVQVDGSAIGSTETLNLEGGTNVTLTESGGTVTIAASGGGSVRTVVAGGNTLGSGETLTLAAGSNISITESNGTVTITATDTNTQLSSEQVQDIVGGMLSGNTESGITVTYDDASNEIDFTVTAGSTHVEDVDLSSSNFSTSISNYYSHATYFVHFSGESTTNEFRIENPDNFASGSVIKIHNLKASAFNIKPFKNGSNLTRLVRITGSGPQTAVGSVSLPGGKALELVADSSGQFLYRM